jgi:uncharacterized YccA/Bax inhibitor family protein
MESKQHKATRDFRRTMKWIVVFAIVMVIGALVFAANRTELTFHLAMATILVVFFSIVLGMGLVALAFFSDKSRRDDAVTDGTEPTHDEDHSSAFSD